MSGHGAFLAVCGFEHHGPKGHLGFAPRVHADDFRAPFTAATGWGTIIQKRENERQRQRIEVKWGSLTLKTLAFEVPPGRRVLRIDASAAQPVEARHAQEGERVLVTLARETELSAGQALEVELTL
jgi:hypothetical protein